MSERSDALKRELNKLQAVQNWCLKSEAAPRLNAMIDLARSEHGIPIQPQQMDSNAWLFNCRNGTLNLEAGKLGEHRREDYITKMSPTEFHSDAPCPQWLNFLDSIFQRDEPLIGYMQKLLGYCLTGHITEQILPIFWGKGANGKSVLVNIIGEVMGNDYALKAPNELLMVHRSDRHPTELASLHGKRFVVTSETAQGGRLNEALIKDLTGSEPITARRMREDFWTFLPTHKVVLLTNHKPIVRGTDEAIWRRLKLIPFNVTFWDPDNPAAVNLPEQHRQDKQLLDKLRQERAGILAWMVRGCLDWQREGLSNPPTVQEATSNYRAAEDLLAQFIAECCDVEPQNFCRRSNLYSAYQKWTETQGEKPLNSKTFGESMTDRGFERYTNNGVCYKGLALQFMDHSGGD